MIGSSEAKALALSLDDVEADLMRLQAQIYRVRQVLERVVGRPVGFQYETPPDEPRAIPTARPL